jgi:hypothetical protein
MIDRSPDAVPAPFPLSLGRFMAEREMPLARLFFGAVRVTNSTI